MINVRILGAERIAKDIQRITQKLRPEIRQAMHQAVLLLEGYVKKHKLSGQVLNVQTGRLRSSITGRVFENADGFEGRVGTSVEYGRLWELGGVIPAHTIRPRKAQALHFSYKGAEVFCKKADIPARKVKPRPFLAPSLDENRLRIIEILGRRVDGVVR